MVSVSLRALNFCGLISSCQDLHFFAWFLCLGSALLLLCKEQVGNVQKTLPIPTSFQPMTKETGVQILPFFALGETILSFFLFFFSWCGPFLKFLLNLLKYCCYFMFWFIGHEPCEISASPPGIKPTPLALEGEVLTTGPLGKSLEGKFWVHASHWLLEFPSGIKLSVAHSGNLLGNDWTFFIGSLSFPVSLLPSPSAPDLLSHKLLALKFSSWVLFLGAGTIPSNLNFCIDILTGLLLSRAATVNLFKSQAGDFPGSPVVKMLDIPYSGYRFSPWTKRFHMLCSTAKKKKEKEKVKLYHIKLSCNFPLPLEGNPDFWFHPQDLAFPGPCLSLQPHPVPCLPLSIILPPNDWLP